MQEALGEEGLQQAYNQALEAAKAAGGLDRQVEARPVTKQGEGSISGRRIIAQKQPGLFAVSYHLWAALPAARPYGRCWIPFSPWSRWRCAWARTVPCM